MSNGEDREDSEDVLAFLQETADAVFDPATGDGAADTGLFKGKWGYAILMFQVDRMPTAVRYMSRGDTRGMLMVLRGLVEKLEKRLRDEARERVH